VTTFPFLLLATVYGARKYFVKRRNASKAFLTATGVGTFGLFCTGALIPAQILDSWIGGHNALHLIRNLCVTTAIWLVRDGLYAIHSTTTNERLRSRFSARPRFLLLILAAITAPFLLQKFVPTTQRFIPENVSQTPVFVYATIYMVALGMLAFSTIRLCVRVEDTLPVVVSMRVVAFGMALIVCASTDEVAYMSFAHLGTTSGGTVELMYWAFDPFFYGGVLVTSLGLGIAPVCKAWRRLHLRSRVFLAALFCAESLFGMKEGRPALKAGFVSQDADTALYEYWIQANDEIILGNKPPWLVQFLLDAAQSGFDKEHNPLQDLKGITP
jgi:hypothetical protein